jgi:tetratricopeptide (TPR) repeat protein
MAQLKLRELLEGAPQAQSAEDLLSAGRAEYQQGRLDRAAELLGLAARANPESADVQHLLGNVEQDLGRLDRAIACYQRALRLNPQRSAAANDLGTAYFAKGLLGEAADAFRHCVALDPSNHRAYENLGSALRRLGSIVPARRAFQRAFWVRLTVPLRKLFATAPAPNEESQLVREAYDAYLAGRYEEAERLCAKRLDQVANDSKALHIRALSLNRLKRYPVALAILEALVQKEPLTAEYHDALGTTLLGLRRHDAALASFNRALALNPRLAVTHSNISALMNERQEHGEAETAARAALQIDPESSTALVTLGMALIGQGRPAEAEVELRRALQIKPRSLIGRLQLCEALRMAGRIDEVRRELDRVREMTPDNPDRHLHLGVLAQEFDRDFHAALEHFRAAQKLAPQVAGPFLNEALLRLTTGEFGREVWDLYEWRKKAPSRLEGYLKVTLPEWDGSRLSAGELLVYGEQGLGDELMFTSILPQALAVAPRLRFAAQPRLSSLFARSFPEVDVFAWDRSGPPDTGSAKFASAIGSLARYFRCSAQEFPQHPGYLKPDPQRLETMRARLGTLGTERKIGIAWRGGVPSTRQARRSLSLAQLAPILQRPGYRWINLQYGAVEKELDEVQSATGVRIERLHDATQDFEESAALISALDLVISVCSTTVHLAGALGQRVWVMAPLAAEWRYGVSGSHMLWYPSAEVFRQPRAGDWDSVIAQIGARLDSFQG